MTTKSPTEEKHVTPTTPATATGLVRVRVVCAGISALLQNRLTEETLECIRTKTKAPKTAPRRTPEEECIPKVHMLDGVPAMPVQNIVSCLIEAGRHVRLDGKKQISTASTTVLPAFVEFNGEYLPLTKRDGATPAPWSPDMRAGRNPNGGEAVCICRPRFNEWQFGMEITVDANQISVDVIRQLYDIAGSRIGLGDFRPARKGTFGRFMVARWEVAA